MPGIRLPFSAHLGQISLVIITFCSCGLSFWLTVRFCADLTPGHATLEVLAMGATWELAKLTFSIKGAYRINRGAPAQKASGYRLAGLSLILAVGSIAASLAFLMQTDQHISQDAAQASQRELEASKTYERDTASLRTLDGEIEQLTALAEQYRAKGLVTQGVRTLERIRPLRDERTTQARVLSAQEATITSSASATVASPLLGTSPRWRLVAQVVLAVMLEVVSMVALSLLCGDPKGAATSGDVATNRPASKVVRLKDASPRITGDTRPHWLASNAAPGAGDANGQPPLSQRIDADVASPRIITDEALHQAASCAAPEDTDASRYPTPLHRIHAKAASPRIITDKGLHRLASSDALGGSDAGCLLSLAPSRRTRRKGRDAQGLRTLYAQAKQLVRTAQVRPCYREMQGALGASQLVVQRFLRNLVAEGVLCRRGTGYALVSPLDANGGAA